MNSTMFSASLAALLLVVGVTRAQEKDRESGLNLDRFPQAVRDALDRAARIYNVPLEGVGWSEASVLSEKGRGLYQFRGKNGRGNNVEIELTGVGRVIEVEEKGVPLREVPTAVLEALEEKMPDFRLRHVEAIYQAERDRPVCYGFEGKNNQGKSVEVYVSADGKRFLN